MNAPSSLAVRPAAQAIAITDIQQQAERAVAMVTQIRQRLVAPSLQKTAPRLSASTLASLCGIDKGQLSYRVGKGDLPPGTLNATGSRREFSLPEARAWTQAYRAARLKPRGGRAVTIAIGNFKGGVTKTTTAMTLAQGLSLRGHRVLAIDTDPQGSLTTLFGILPETEVSEEQTINALCAGDQDGIRYAIQPSYWDGIDLVAANPTLFSAEFALPARQMREPQFEFWNVLNRALDEVREEYDFIIIDTPPSLSYVTINGFMASDGLIVPLVPSALDFASSAQFWSLFSDLSTNLVNAGLQKSFSFIHVLMARVDTTDAASGVVRQWIGATYAEKVLPVEIPKTAVTSATAAEFGTVYDLTRYEGSQKTYKRARDAYDRLVELVEESAQGCWAEAREAAQ